MTLANLAVLAFVVLGYLIPVLYVVVVLHPVESVRLVLGQPGWLKGWTGHSFVEVRRVGSTVYLFLYGIPFSGLVGSIALALFVAVLVTLIALVSVYPVRFSRFALYAWLLLTVVGMLSFPFVDALALRNVMDIEHGLPSLMKRFGFVVVLRGFALLALYEALVWLPLASAVVGGYFLSLPQEEIESALQFGARGLGMLSFMWRSMKPGLISLTMLVAVLVLDDVGGPYIFQDDAFARGLLAYRAYSYFVESAYGRLSLIGLGYALILLLISLLFFSVAYGYGGVVVTRGGKPSSAVTSVAGFRPNPLLLVLLLPSFMLRILSVIYVFADRWVGLNVKLGLAGIRGLFSSPDLLCASLNSVVYAMASVAIMSAAGLYLGWYTARGMCCSKLWRLVAVAPLGIPGVVVAYAYFLFYGRVLPVLLYSGVRVLLVLGYSVRRLPPLYEVLRSLVESVPRSLEEAGYNVGAGLVRVLLLIVAPVVFDKAYGAVVFTSLSVAGEVSLSVTLGGLSGSSGCWHPAPLMYLVAGYTGLSGLAYASAAAAATLLAYTLTVVAVTLFYAVARRLGLLFLG